MINKLEHQYKLITSSKYYFAFLIVQLCLSLAILLFILIDPAENLKNPGVQGLEILLAISIFFDIVTRIIFERKNFFKSFWNIMDLVSFSVIGLLLTIFYLNEFHLKEVSISEEMETDDIIGTALISIRYVLQVARLCASIKKERFKQKLNKGVKEINLADFQVEHTNIRELQQGDNFQKQIEKIKNLQSSRSTVDDQSDFSNV